MLAEVKRCADHGDIMGLRYIFVDSLDVDPTFEHYREEYEYCKNIDGLFDEHRDLSPLVSDQTQWTLPYWDQLKIDLLNNFSQRRFEHMIDAARIVHADKVARLMVEREKRQRLEQRKIEIEENNRRVEEKQRKDRERVERARAANGFASQNTPPSEQSTLSDSEKQKQRLEQRRREIEENNRRVEEKQRKDRERVERARAAYGGNEGAQYSGTGLKKAPGAVLAVLAAIVVVLVIAMLLGHSPR